ncbi:MAG: 2-hydroxyacyl-CoA dehydratase [Deltaproteobacteria bacterium]|nr:2-hydroxyacyl-CoA dehydratase [Deltaproteobacteria bacterium]
MNASRPKIGFACAYTPLALIDAAGFAPYRMFPLTDAPDRAGALMHDNMCPHVKRVLDRALAGDLPDLGGVVFMNSCESMRRLADAWRIARPADAFIFADLPSTADPNAEEFFAEELRALFRSLCRIAGRQEKEDAIPESINKYNTVSEGLVRLRRRVASGAVSGGYARLQEIVNKCVTTAVDDAARMLGSVETSAAAGESRPAGVPVFVFGNVMSDPAAFELLERSGCRVVGDDLCTGTRQLAPIPFDAGSEPFAQLARGLLARSPCARTVDASRPGILGGHIAKQAAALGAKGVVAYVMKFCDPYLARLPAVRESLRARSLPLLVIEGDCTTRSLGQQRTRIEAFAETLGGGRR